TTGWGSRGTGTGWCSPSCASVGGVAQPWQKCRGDASTLRPFAPALPTKQCYPLHPFAPTLHIKERGWQRGEHREGRHPAHQPGLCTTGVEGVQPGERTMCPNALAWVQKGTGGACHAMAHAGRRWKRVPIGRGG
ncbi:hypothetical protein EI94DRAFT_1702305, partial [Lactarius quietus]